MKRSKLAILRQNQSILGAALLSVSMATVGCSKKTDPNDDDSSSSEDGDNENTSDKNKNSTDKSTAEGSGGNSTPDSGMGSGMDSKPTGTEMGTDSSGADGDSSSTEKAPDPTSVDIEVALDGEVTVQGQLRVTLDVSLGLGTALKTGANIFGEELKLTNGKAKLTVPHPAKDIDFGGEKGQDYYGIILVTAYDDLNKNGKYDKAETIVGAAKKALVYSRHGNDKGWDEWQELLSGQPMPIEGPFELVRLDQLETVTGTDIGGKIADLGIDVSHVTSVTFDETADLKKNFNDTARPMELTLDKNQKTWSIDLPEGVDDARRRKGGYPTVIPGMKKPGLEFPVGFLETSANGGKLTADTKYEYLCMYGGSGIDIYYTALMLAWIEPGTDWIEDLAGADIAARFGLNPGWNVLGVYQNYDGDYVPVGVNDILKNALSTSKGCYLAIPGGEDDGEGMVPKGAVVGVRRVLNID